LTIATVYDSIKHSNSSLRRRSKKQLEDAIDRVLMVLKEEQDDSESLDGDFEGIEEALPVLKVGNRMDGTCGPGLTGTGAQYYEQEHHKVMGKAFNINNSEPTTGDSSLEWGFYPISSDTVNYFGDAFANKGRSPGERGAKVKTTEGGGGE
jgi:hypothetical protein